MSYDIFKHEYQKAKLQKCIVRQLPTPITYMEARDLAIKKTKENLKKEIEYGFLFNPNKIHERHIEQLFEGDSKKCQVDMMPRGEKGSFHTHPMGENDDLCLISQEDMGTDIGRRIVVGCVYPDEHLNFVNMDLRLRGNKEGDVVLHYKHLLDTFDDLGNLTEKEYFGLIDLVQKRFAGDII